MNTSTMNTPTTEELRALLVQRGWITGDAVRFTPLTGGVSSEIYLVDQGTTQFVVKRALPKLKVEADWYADTGRNHAEQAYIRYVGAFRPDAMPAIIGSDAAAGLFAMEYLARFRNWKKVLLAGEAYPALARNAGELLGEIHARSWGDQAAKAVFGSLENFDQLRVDPYLRATAAVHPELASSLLAEATRLLQSQECLIHGDYSPKNILFTDARLVPLDCEVACYGDAAFDLGFLLNHLFLKSLYHAPQRPHFGPLIDAVRSGYRGANARHADAVEARTARLLPMLMLARVDGKSPVEYLDAARQALVRQFVRQQLQQSPSSNNLGTLQARWLKAI